MTLSYSPVATEEAWGAGTTQPCHLSPDQRDPAEVWQEPRTSMKATFSMELESSICIGYAGWGSSPGNGLHPVLLSSLKRCSGHLGREVRFVSTCNLEKLVKWRVSERRSMSGMLKQKHGEGEAVEMWSLTCLQRISTQTELQWEMFLGLSPAFLRTQSISYMHGLSTEQWIMAENKDRIMKTQTWSKWFMNCATVCWPLFVLYFCT